MPRPQPDHAHAHAAEVERLLALEYFRGNFKGTEPLQHLADDG